MRRGGFSLIELLIVIVIMGSIATVGVTNYREFGKRQDIDNLARTLEGDVRQAQSDAANGRILTGCVGAFQGYRVRFFTNSSGTSTSYALIATCATASVVEKTVVLPTNLVLNLNRVAAGGVFDILFKPLQLGTDVPPGNNVVLTVQSATGVTTNTQTITITSSGEIK